ncbi:hypothetical protein NDU88_006592 [Pleurodeles waltl]|uniref:Uncharacterized protein n=1 Tax=Pleurodeles waltl TaxID=8319 RepID=A0AAV7ULF8_PLEWA|nr:hypothetical protein NDU88_006592 [Pleurodeles waltl]
MAKISTPHTFLLNVPIRQWNQWCVLRGVGLGAAGEAAEETHLDGRVKPGGAACRVRCLGMGLWRNRLRS